VATNISTLSAAQPPIDDQLGSYYSYPQWKAVYSEEDFATEQDLPSYLDYYRGELLKRGELTREKEVEIQNYYANWASNGDEISQEEFEELASQSTAYLQGSEKEAAIVSRIFPALDWGGLNPAQQNDYLNRSKKALLSAGELPFASLVEGGRGTVQVGNYGSLGTSQDRQTRAGAEALQAYYAGAIDPRDLWQVSEGLSPSAMPNKTNFQADLDERDLQTFREVLGRKDSDYSRAINNAIINSIDLETYKGNWFTEVFADRPEDITQIIVDDLPDEIVAIQPMLIREIARKQGLGDAEIAGLNLENNYRFSNERFFSLIKELAINHANNQGVFKYDSKNLTNNIRVTPLGLPVAHPDLMRSSSFKEVVEGDTRLNQNQKKSLLASRKNYISSLEPYVDGLLTSENLQSSVGESWLKAKTDSPASYEKDYESFYDRFFSEKKNYDESANWWGGFFSSVPEAVVGMGASLGALLGFDKASEHLAEYQSSQSRRRQLASLFGEDMGWKYDLATIVPAVGADLGASYLLAGPFTKLAKKPQVAQAAQATKAGVRDIKHFLKTETSNIMATFKGDSPARIAAKKKLARDIIDPDKTTSAIKGFNDLTARRYGIQTAIFTTAANRAAGSTYATLYNSQPEDMSHEEKHDKALGPSLLRGTATGLITTGFSALGFKRPGAGGVEDIISKGVSFGSFKKALNSLPEKAFTANSSTLKAALKGPLKDTITKAIINNKQSLIGTTLRGAFYEGAEESIDEFVGSYIESISMDEFVPMRERINQAVYAGTLGGVLGGAVSLGAETKFGLAGMQRLAESRSIKRNQKVAEDEALRQLSDEVEAAGAPLVAQELENAANAPEELDTPEEVDAPEELDTPEEVDAPEVDAPEETPVAPIDIFTPKFSGKEVPKETVENYLMGWVPTGVTQGSDIRVDFKKFEGSEANPMRVVALNARGDSPMLVWQVDSEALSQKINSQKGNKKDALDSYIGHELIHLSELEYARDLWRNSGQETNFVNFYDKYTADIYGELTNSEAGLDEIRKSVSQYLGIEESEVILPDEGLSQMTKGEIVSEFTRQFAERANAGSVSDAYFQGLKKKDKRLFLENLQGLVDKVRGTVGDTTNNDAYDFIQKSTLGFLAKVEDRYASFFLDSVQGRFLDFNTKVEQREEALAQEVPEETPAVKVPEEVDVKWKEALEEYGESTKLSGKPMTEERALRKELALIQVFESYIVADRNLMGFSSKKGETLQDLPMFLNQKQLELLKGWFEGGKESFPEELRLSKYEDTAIRTNTLGQIKEIAQEIESTSGFLLATHQLLNPELGLTENFVLSNAPSEVFNVATEVDGEVVNHIPPPVNMSPMTWMEVEAMDSFEEIAPVMKELTEELSARAKKMGLTLEVKNVSYGGSLSGRSDVLNVSDGKVIVNIYQLAKQYNSFHRPDQLLGPSLKASMAIRNAEDKVINDIDFETVASNIDDAQLIAFLSQEISPYLNLDPKTVEDLTKDGVLNIEEGGKVLSNYVKSFVAKGRESQIPRDEFLIINSFASLKDAAIQALEKTIVEVSKIESLLEGTTQGTKVKVYQSSDQDTRVTDQEAAGKDMLLSNYHSGNLLGYLKQGRIAPLIKEISFDTGDVEASIDMVRNMVAESSVPEESKPVPEKEEVATSEEATPEKEKEEEEATPEDPELAEMVNDINTSLEIPLVSYGFDGRYTTTEESAPLSFVGKIWKWLSSNKDLRWQREVENRDSYSTAINEENKMIVGALNRIVKKDFGGWTPRLKKLVSQASGNTAGTTLPEGELEQFKQERDLELDEAKASYTSPENLKEKLESAYDNFEKKIADRKGELIALNKESVNQAYNEIAKTSPELVKELRDVRRKITANGRVVGMKLQEVDSDKYEDGPMRFSEQEGFYLSRSYRIFKDPKWRADILNLENKQFKLIREEAARAVLDEEIAKAIDAEIDSRNKLAMDEGDMSWLETTEIEKRQIVDEELGISKSFQGNKLDLESFYVDHFSKYGPDEQTDILTGKQQLSEAVRKGLGEIESPKYNLVQTLTNVRSFGNSLALDLNLMKLGRPKDADISEYWILNLKEYDKLKKDNPEEARRYSHIHRTKTINGESVNIKTNPLSPLRNAEAQYYVDDNFYNALAEREAFVSSNKLTDKAAGRINKFLKKAVGLSLGFKTLGSSTYYSRNIFGSAIFFPWSQGFSPGKTIKNLGKELKRLRNPQEVNEYVLNLYRRGMLEPEFTVSMLSDMLSGEVTADSLEAETFKLYDDIQKDNNLPPIEEGNPDALLKTLVEAGKKGNLYIKDNVLKKLTKLSMMTDSFFKISYFENEVKNLQEARQYEKDLGTGGSYINLTDSEIESLAADKVKKTAQFYSQSSVLTDAFNKSSAALAVAPYVRFRMEVARIMVNSMVLARREMKDSNPVIRARGKKRAAGLATVGLFSATGSIIAEPVLVTLLIGLQLADEDASDLDDETRQALRLASPSYLRDHTFLYSKKNGQYQSWDLTYLNPYAMWLDGFSIAGRSINNGESLPAAMGRFGLSMLGTPLVEGQIATNAFFNSIIMNRNSKGETLYYENDSPINKATKSVSNFIQEAYGPPSFKRLNENIKGLATGESEYTIGKLIRDEFSPIKPYDVKPQQVLYGLTRSLRQGKLRNSKLINRVLTTRPLSESEVNQIADETIRISKITQLIASKHLTKLINIGVDPAIITEEVEKLYGKGSSASIFAGQGMVQMPSARTMGAASQRPEVAERIQQYIDRIEEKTNNGLINLYD